MSGIFYSADDGGVAFKVLAFKSVQYQRGFTSHMHRLHYKQEAYKHEPMQRHAAGKIHHVKTLRCGCSPLCNLLNLDCALLHSADYNVKIPLSFLISYSPWEFSPLLILAGCLPGVWIKDFAFSPKGAPCQPFVLTTRAMRVHILKQKLAPSTSYLCWGVLLIWEFLYLLKTSVLQTRIHSLTVTAVDLLQSFFATTSIRVRSSSQK